MKELIERFRQQGGDGKKKVSWLFLMGLAGMLLILVSDLFGGKPPGKSSAPAGQELSPMAYIAQLEEKLQKLLVQVDGAGRTQVMITLDTTQETVYATDHKEQGSDGTQETKHILMDTAQGESALVETTWQPEIRGVAVVCEGGGDVIVASRITQIVSALLGVSTNRISVAKMS